MESALKTRNKSLKETFAESLKYSLIYKSILLAYLIANYVIVFIDEDYPWVGTFLVYTSAMHRFESIEDFLLPLWGVIILIETICLIMCYKRLNN